MGKKRSKPARIRSREHVKAVDSSIEFTNLLGDIIAAVKDSQKLLDAIRRVSKEVYSIGSVATEAIGPARAFAKIVEKIFSIDDPLELARIGCCLAWRQAVLDGLAVLPSDRRPVPGYVERRVADAVRQNATLSDIDFSTFTLDRALQHPFTTHAERELENLFLLLDLSETEQRRALDDIRSAFSFRLRTLLSSSDSAKRFLPWRDFLAIPSERSWSRIGLPAHIQYQRWLYRAAPVLQVESFSLHDVYVNPECGVATWRELTSTRLVGVQTGRANPFDESVGGRSDLLVAVLSAMRAPAFRDAIVIQGVAGAGKSTFTLKLCDVLADHGLSPVRVRLRDLRTDLPVLDAIAEAVTFCQPGEQPPIGLAPHRLSIFDGGSALDDLVSYGDAQISRIVLILDGWDEIQTGSAGLHAQIEGTLREVRQQFLNRPNRPPVRVVLTGRPSDAVRQSRFIQDDTRIFTIRPMRPHRVEDFARKVESAMLVGRLGRESTWQMVEHESLSPVLRAYEQWFAGRSTTTADHRTGIDLMAQPLLALLSFRLMSKYGIASVSLFENRAALYRELADITCEGAGQPIENSPDPADRSRITGSRLRRALHAVATAISAHGEESLPSATLLKWFAKLHLDIGNDASIDKHPLASLMVSFFFHTGQNDLGNEFVHKSFREFFFAEGIVELLREYGRTVPEALPARSPFWKDFQREDPRFQLSRCLVRRLGPQWLTPEVVGYLTDLLVLDMRPGGSDDSSGSGGGLTIEQWCRVRDGLADVWEWWSEGVHLRPCPTGQDVNPHTAPPVDQFVEDSIPPSDAAIAQTPIRSTTVDAHLGDALYRLCTTVHATLWITETTSRSPRPCQHLDHDRRVRFAPAGRTQGCFRLLCARINSAGWRPRGDFPGGTSSGPVYLSGEDISGLRFDDSILYSADLSNTKAIGVSFNGTNMNHALLFDATLDHSVFVNASLKRAVLDGAHIESVSLDRVNLSFATVQKCDFSRSYFRKVTLTSARMQSTKFCGAVFEETTCDQADFQGADFSYSRLVDANFSGVLLRDSDFRHADLRGANFEGASLQGSDFDGAVLQDAKFNNADVSGSIPFEPECFGAQSERD
jgi:uncharacterized protein YjbI with pentapeptide repeats